MRNEFGSFALSSISRTEKVKMQDPQVSTEMLSHSAASDWPMVRWITCWITAYLSASFILICTTSTMIAPKRQRGHFNLVKNGHYDFALSMAGLP